MTSRTARAKQAASIHDPRFPAHRTFSEAELHQRAVARMPYLKTVARITGRPIGLAPHASTGTAPKRHTRDRVKERAAARAAFDAGIAREHAIGISPVYLGKPRGGSHHKAWQAEAKTFTAAPKAKTKSA